MTIFHGILTTLHGIAERLLLKEAIVSANTSAKLLNLVLDTLRKLVTDAAFSMGTPTTPGMESPVWTTREACIVGDMNLVIELIF